MLEASRHGDVEIVRLLLSHGANKEARRTPDQNTPLLLATQCNRISVIKELLRARASCDAENKDGHNALDIACFEGHWEAARLLLTEGTAKVFTKNRHGDTPLHCAVHRAGDDFVAFLLARGAPLNVLCNAGTTPLYEACFRDVDPNFVERLIAAGADPW